MTLPPPMVLARSPELEGFFVGGLRGELRVEGCLRCGRLRHPPGPMCPYCRSPERAWVQVSGQGSIWSFVVPHPPLLPGFTELAPYNVVLVALDEDPDVRMVGNLVQAPGGAPNEVDPATIRIGERVRAVFSVLSGELVLQWVRVGTSGSLSGAQTATGM